MGSIWVVGQGLHVTAMQVMNSKTIPKPVPKGLEIPVIQHLHGLYMYCKTEIRLSKLGRVPVREGSTPVEISNLSLEPI